MAEGTYRITLNAPGDRTGVDSYGEVQHDPPQAYEAFATRTDRGGRAPRENEGIEFGEWDTLFRVRHSRRLEGMTTAWWVLDDRGRRWDITRVSEVPYPRRRWLNIYCRAHTGGRG